VAAVVVEVVVAVVVVAAVVVDPVVVVPASVVPDSWVVVAGAVVVPAGLVAVPVSGDWLSPLVPDWPLRVGAPPSSCRRSAVSAGLPVGTLASCAMPPERVPFSPG
jgi:hypothetical protein